MDVLIRILMLSYPIRVKLTLYRRLADVYYKLMSNIKKQKRFTLSLPEKVHEELTSMANERGITSKEVVIKCLKLGLLALSTEDDVTKELILRESNNNEVKETKLILI